MRLLPTIPFFCVAQALPAQQWLSQSPLQFDNDGNFKISIFEDLHYGESKSSPLSNVRLADQQQMHGMLGVQSKTSIAPRS